MDAHSISHAATRIYEELERRFIHKETGLLLNYTDLDGSVPLPTEEEVRLGKPSHLSWNCPIEDGAYYSGLYLDALSDRRLNPLLPNAAKTAERVAEGLLSLAQNAGVNGFVARNYIHNTHYACGSEDQTFPWFYGLYKYIKSGIPNKSSLSKCIDSLIHVAEALHERDYTIPCATEDFGIKGNLAAGEINNIAKLLFIQLAAYDLTHDEKWLCRYRESLFARPCGKTLTRFEILKNGVQYPVYDGASVFYCIESGEGANEVFGKDIRVTTLPFFTMSMANIAIKAITEMETDPEIRIPLQDALEKDARLSASHIQRFKGFSLASAPKYSGNWRVMNAVWHAQANSVEAAALAWRQMPVWFRECPRFPYENAFVREPLFAAYISLLPDNPPDASQIREIVDMLRYYPYEKLHTSTFYMALSVCKQLLQ